MTKQNYIYSLDVWPAIKQIINDTINWRSIEHLVTLFTWKFLKKEIEGFNFLRLVTSPHHFGYILEACFRTFVNNMDRKSNSFSYFSYNLCGHTWPKYWNIVHICRRVFHIWVHLMVHNFTRGEFSLKKNYIIGFTTP